MHSMQKVSFFLLHGDNSLTQQTEVTERHRTSPIPSRLFPDMVEITNMIEHGGHRGHRSEMGEVRKWIEERGVSQDILGKVLNLG